ncbi:MAG: type III-A CRISPR-associated protein Csm2 [Lachnospiraceae bacterium]|nr:type III-A CRISPR-associated protein Csm2 [Lachnospiraceae bacterium]
MDQNNYADEAEKVIKKLSGKTNARTGKPEPMVTTSKLRNLLAMSNDIYYEILMKKEERLEEELIGRIEYLRIRFVYEAGREAKVRELVEEAHILDILKEIKGIRENYLLFSKYMESLVAFHRFYGGKDN